MSQTKNQIRDLPPSAKLVLKVLENDDSLTQKEIVLKSRLSQRTVRDALNRLQDRDLIEETLYPPDGRQNLYLLTDEGATQFSDGTRHH